MLHKESLRTSRPDEMIDITRQVAALVSRQGVQEGLIVVYCPHTTAGIAINENADPDVKRDVLMRLDEVYENKKPEHAVVHMPLRFRAFIIRLRYNTCPRLFREWPDLV